jgi:hypothetical protein
VWYQTSASADRGEVWEKETKNQKPENQNRQTTKSDPSRELPPTPLRFASHCFTPLRVSSLYAL